jgi:hypothetical protein
VETQKQTFVPVKYNDQSGAKNNRGYDQLFSKEGATEWVLSVVLCGFVDNGKIS